MEGVRKSFIRRKIYFNSTSNTAISTFNRQDKGVIDLVFSACGGQFTDITILHMTFYGSKSKGFEVEITVEGFSIFNSVA